MTSALMGMVSDEAVIAQLDKIKDAIAKIPSSSS